MTTINSERPNRISIHWTVKIQIAGKMRQIKLTHRCPIDTMLVCCGGVIYSLFLWFTESIFQICLIISNTQEFMELKNFITKQFINLLNGIMNLLVTERVIWSLGKTALTLRIFVISAEIRFNSALRNHAIFLYITFTRKLHLHVM